MTQLAGKAKTTIKDLDPTNELKFLRVGSRHHEILVGPDKEFTLIVVHGQKTHKKEDD